MLFQLQQRFRQRSHVVEAVRYDGSNLPMLAAWSEGAVREPEFDEPGDLTIDRRDGETKPVYIDDWVVKGDDGECFCVARAVFEAVYEPADMAPD